MNKILLFFITILFSLNAYAVTNVTFWHMEGVPHRVDRIQILIDEFNSAKDPMERLEIHRKIQALPRNCAPNRIRNRCWATGKPRGVYRDFGLCRNQLRSRAHNGELPGVVKSSW